MKYGKEARKSVNKKNNKMLHKKITIKEICHKTKKKFQNE